jgi:hypothetical protein
MRELVEAFEERRLLTITGDNVMIHAPGHG